MALTTNDIVQIQQLYASYCWALDDGDGPAVAACFTAAGVIDTVVRGVFSGRSEIGRYMPGIVPWDQHLHLAHDPRDLLRHMAYNIELTGDADAATGRAYLMVTTSRSGTPEIIFTGRFPEDRLERTGDGWRFAYRRVVQDAAG